MNEIIGPLVEMPRKDDMAGLLAFTRMTGDSVKAVQAAPSALDYSRQVAPICPAGLEASYRAACITPSS